MFDIDGRVLTSPSISGVVAKSFHGVSGSEHYLAIEADAALDFGDQLALIEARYAEARRRLGLGAETAVFRRIFLSDVLNQIDSVTACGLACEPADSPAAVSIVQQPPLTGAKVALLAYHVTGEGGLRKRRVGDRHLLVEKNGLRHLWSTRLRAGAEGPDASAEEQTRAVFAELVDTLASQGGSLADHCVRTWIYVKDVDVFYSGMGRGRTAAFAKAGLTEDTHYIASTGIEGACGRAYDVVAMDAYSMLDLAPGQMSYLNDLDRMCLTKDYNVTFERGARVAYADRAHLFVSGTASIDARGQVLHQGDVLAQLDRALGNVEAILRSGGANLNDLTHLIVYLRDPTDYPKVRDRLDGLFKALPMVIVHGPVCRHDWLIEVEGLAITPNQAPSLPAF
jgi:enamine deaminase RidA (YjgF/YER057c/UK114 family)